MNLQPNDVQLGLADAARALLDRVAPLTSLVSREEPTQLHDQIWKQAASQGWLALGLPEDLGGLGLGLPEELMVFRELGRSVTPGPFVATVLAARLAAGAGELDLATSIGVGERRVGMVVDDVVIDARPGELALRLDGSGGELLEPGDLTVIAGTDPHTPTARIAAGRTAAGRTVVRHDDPALISRARVLVAAELLGIIEAVRDMSASYAQVRAQFGKPIGSFQAVKHRCADMAIAAVATVGEVYQAGLYVEAGHPDAAFHAASAYILAAKGAYRSAADNIQNHGGIGFTWEHPAHLYLKRAVVLENLLGPRRASLDAVLAPTRHEFR